MKKLLWLLTFMLVWLINFWYCDFFNYPTIEWTLNLSTYSRNFEIITNWENVCVYWVLVDYLWVYDWSPQNWWEYLWSVNQWYIYCNTEDYWVRNNYTENLTVLYWNKPITSSLDCQIEYNLIPISSVDQNYCVSNWLCPSSNCSWNVNTWDIQWSALYINQIQHVSAPVINIDIPEEISRDYESDDEEFNLTIWGYNVDTEYIEWVINLQNSKPNQVDLNYIIQVIIPLFVPWLVVILFIYFVFRFIKKIF